MRRKESKQVPEGTHGPRKVGNAGWEGHQASAALAGLSRAHDEFMIRSVL